MPIGAHSYPAMGFPLGVRMIKQRFLLLGILLLIVLGSSLPVYAAEDKPITVFVEGRKLSFDIDPIIENGVTLVQFRPIFTALGIDIQWDAESKTITGKKEDFQIQLTIGKSVALVNGVRRTLEAAPRLVEGNTVIPLRFVAEATAKRVSWDERTKTIRITKGIEYAGTVDQYGEDSYDPDNYSETLGHNRPVIHEEDGYLYVLWSRDVSIPGNTTYTHFLVSIAKDGKWIVRNHSFKIQDRKDIHETLFFGRSLYVRDNMGLRKVTVKENGFPSYDDYIVHEPKIRGYNDRETILPVYAGDSTGVLFGTPNRMHLYLDNAAKRDPIAVKDLHGLLFDGMAKSRHYVYNADKGLLYLYEGNTIRQLVVSSGDLIFNKDGKDKVVQVGKSSKVYLMYDKGTMVVFYRESSDRMLKMVTVDANLNVSDETRTNFLAKALPSYTLTQSSDEYHFWLPGNFERRPSVSLIRLSK